MNGDIMNTLDHGERVTSAYAEIYMDDDYCEYKKKLPEEAVDKVDTDIIQSEWVSPSDLLIGIIELIPPFTSKITRGKTHEGILAIGDAVLQNEYKQHKKRIQELLNENDSAWRDILEHEKKSVLTKVKDIYGKIFIEKTKIMQQEINAFYETTLHEMENNLKSQVQDVLISTHANIVNHSNTEIKEKLLRERKILEQALKNKYEKEIEKIKHYYKLLLQNEKQRYIQLVNRAIIERNDALKAFYRQIEAENITSTMYIMSLERKKCKIKQFVMENYQTLELTEKYNKIKERQGIIDAFKEKDVHISDINKTWEEKIKKILEIFLKFISFSLKLLPEQTSFLLDLEKMLVLQLNEIQKVPHKAPSIILDEEKFKNVFKFESFKEKESGCTKDPLVGIGDMSEPIPPIYGSQETIPSDVDLPFVRLQREYVYAKCHGYEEIKTLLEAQRCKCSDIPSNEPSQESVPASLQDFEEAAPLASKKPSSNEILFSNDFQRLHECPVRSCKEWSKRYSFPYLDSYLDFTEDNYRRVKAILGKLPKLGRKPELIDPKPIIFSQLPFSPTKEPYHTVETQYSSREDLYVPEIECPCTATVNLVKRDEFSSRIKDTESEALNKILAKRKVSLRRLLGQNPNLLKVFTDESFDFVL